MKDLKEVAAVSVILLSLSFEDLVKKFSHSWDSTGWATEYPCSYSVLALERALVRTGQKQDLFWLLWCLWPSLNAVLQTTSFFSWLVLMQVISVSCADFQSVPEYHIYKLISVFCLMKCHHFLRPSSQVPGTSFLPFLICQHLSFVTWYFARVVTSSCTFYLWNKGTGSFLYLFFFFPFCVSGMIAEEGGK